jgi:uncharacterized protein (DUF1501 family)
MSICCDEFARAGRGLPAIEPGMPAPAGTGLDRRTFLAKSLGVGLSVYGATRLPIAALEEGIASAAGLGDGRILVTVFLPGGADALSLLYPAGDPSYRKLRPKLALPDSVGTAFAEDDRLRWHPSLAGFAQLHKEGKIGVLPSVGYTHPDQSHFTSRHFWEVGATETSLRTGWLGRYLDRVGSPSNPLQGLSLDGQLLPALATARVPVAALAAADDYTFGASGVWDDVEDAMLDALAPLGAAGAASNDPALRLAGSVAVQADTLRRQLSPFAQADGDFGTTVPYPKSKDDFPVRLQGLAALIGANLPLRCIALAAPGEYDTHANQAKDLADGLKLTADSLVAFQRDLEARGLADRVLTLVWSEFGRRAEENGNAGTDHGAAGSGFVIGTRSTGKLIGEFPGLTALDGDGNLKPTVDYRAVYSSLLEQWLGTDAAGIIPGAAQFARPKLVR